MSSRRSVGLAAFQNRTSVSTSYATHGASLRSTHLASVQTQLSVFQSQLHAFALQHGDAIRSQPAFRAEFARMCEAIGVDPLAASVAGGKAASSSGSGSGGGGVQGGQGGGGIAKGKDRGGAGGGGRWWGLWKGARSGEGDLLLRLAIGVVGICRGSRSQNGGLLGVAECREMVKRAQRIGGDFEVTDADILRAVECLKPLGSGFSIVTVGSKQMIRSIPKELSTDQSTVLEAIQAHQDHHITASMLERNLGWEPERAETCLEDLLADSLVWVDLQSGEKEYWAPPTDDAG